MLPHLSVAENMLLGRMPSRGLSFIVDWAEASRIAARVLADFGFPEIPPRALVGSLSVARQQIVEIAKALVAQPKILILDEPTAVLSAAEADKLFDKVRSLAAGGTTVLYISHRIEEIYAIADEIVVLKDGRSVLSGEVAELSHRIASSRRWSGDHCPRSSRNDDAQSAGQCSRSRNSRAATRSRTLVSRYVLARLLACLD